MSEKLMTSMPQMNQEEALIAIKACLSHKKPFLLVGQPGIGKTSLIKQACETSDIEYLEEDPGTCDATDPKGLPWVTNGEANFIPFGNAKRLIEATRPLCYNLDDFGQAAPLVQASFAKLIHSGTRAIGGQRISDHVTIVATTNRKQDKSGVSGMLEMIKSRFHSVFEVTFDVDAWVRWALKAGLPTQGIAFAKFKPDILIDFKAAADMTNSCTPRTFEAACETIGWNLPPSVELNLMGGAIGMGAASEFSAFLQIWRTLPSIDQILLNPRKVEVPGEISTLYALSAVIARKADVGNFQALAQYIERMPAEYQTLVMKLASMRDETIMQTRAAIDILANNGALG